MSGDTFKFIRYDANDIGEYFKESKTLHYWEFSLNRKTHKIELYHSRLSGKRRIYIDSKECVNQRNLFSEFSYSFILDKTYFNVVEVQTGGYDLRANNKSVFNYKSEETFDAVKGDKRSELNLDKEKDNNFGFEEETKKYNFRKDEKKEEDIFGSKAKKNNVIFDDDQDDKKNSNFYGGNSANKKSFDFLGDSAKNQNDLFNDKEFEFEGSSNANKPTKSSNTADFGYDESNKKKNLGFTEGNKNMNVDLLFGLSSDNNNNNNLMFGNSNDQPSEKGNINLLFSNSSDNNKTDNLILNSSSSNTYKGNSFTNNVYNNKNQTNNLLDLGFENVKPKQDSKVLLNEIDFGSIGITQINANNGNNVLNINNTQTQKNNKAPLNDNLFDFDSRPTTIQTKNQEYAPKFDNWKDFSNKSQNNKTQENKFKKDLNEIDFKFQIAELLSKL